MPQHQWGYTMSQACWSVGVKNDPCTHHPKMVFWGKLRDGGAYLYIREIPLPSSRQHGLVGFTFWRQMPTVKLSMTPRHHRHQPMQLLPEQTSSLVISYCKLDIHPFCICAMLPVWPIPHRVAGVAESPWGPSWMATLSLSIPSPLFSPPLSLWP